MGVVDVFARISDQCLRSWEMIGARTRAAEWLIVLPHDHGNPLVDASNDPFRTGADIYFAGIGEAAAVAAFFGLGLQQISLTPQRHDLAGPPADPRGDEDPAIPRKTPSWRRGDSVARK